MYHNAKPARTHTVTQRHNTKTARTHTVTQRHLSTSDVFRKSPGFFAVDESSEKQIDGQAVP